MGGGAVALPSLVRNINYIVGQFLLQAIFLFMFCFTNILNIFFSFVTCSMHNTKMQEMALKRLYFSKFSPDPPRVRQIRVCPPPPKFLSPYTYAFMCSMGCILSPKQILYTAYLLLWSHLYPKAIKMKSRVRVGGSQFLKNL